MTVNPDRPLFLPTTADAAHQPNVRINKGLPVGDPSIGMPGAVLDANEERASEKALEGVRPSQARLITAYVNPSKLSIQFGSHVTEEQEKEAGFIKKVQQAKDNTVAAMRAQKQPEHIIEQKAEAFNTDVIQGQNPVRRAVEAARRGADLTIEHDKNLAIPLNPSASEVTEILRREKNGYWKDIRNK